MNLQDRSLYRGKIFELVRRNVVLNDGSHVERDVVLHPGAAVILPVLDDEHIIMIRNYRYSVDKTLLELPAGTLEANEAPEHCASRELEEETGYRANKIESLCNFYATPGICTERMYGFVASDLEKTQQNLDESEEIEVSTFHISQILNELEAGNIEDAKTLTLLLYWLFIHPSGASTRVLLKSNA